MKAAFILLLAAGTAIADPLPAPAPRNGPPDRRELWVPMDKLGTVLKDQKAVVLTREQYATLLRDAGADKTPAVQPPRPAVQTSAHYTARIDGKTVVIAGELRVNVLTDLWAEVPLEFPNAALGELKLDANTAIAPRLPELPPILQNQGAAPAGKALVLLVRGQGEHVLHVTLTAPVVTTAGRSSVSFTLPGTASGAFSLALPPRTEVKSAVLPADIITGADGSITSKTALTPALNPISLTWRNVDAAPVAFAAIGAELAARYTLDAEKLGSAFRLHLSTPFGDLPAAFDINLPPEAKVLGVETSELAAWEAKDGKLSIRLQPGARQQVDLLFGVELPALGNANTATLSLPIPEIAGVRRLEGQFSLSADDSIVVRDVAMDAATRRVASDTDRGGRAFAAAYQFHSRPAPPRVSVERTQPKLEADLDTLIEFRTEGVYFQRMVTLRNENGRRFQTTITLPEGEELVSVRHLGETESEPEWRAEKNAITIKWADESPAPRVFKLNSRLEPASWTQLPAEGLPFTVRDAVIQDVQKKTGYIGLVAEAAYRLETTAGEMLERRDGRTTPVRGDYAWFRRDAFDLSVRVYKRPAEVLAALTGYAVPLEGILDLHATMNYQFLHGGARSVRLRVPKEIAANFQFEGPQIAERTLAGDVWTITFQKELTGSYALSIAAQVSVPKLAGAGEDTARGYSFSTKVPVIAPLDVSRASGLWAVEANTETEISFDAKGLNELDTLLAPQLPDYQPRHRVIGVFGWIGADYSLGLRGVRHAPAAMLPTVVDRLELDTVVSPGGLHRHQAAYFLRTSGAQYLDVALPAGASLLSLAVDGEPVKPVTSVPGTVRVRLPAKRDANAAIAIHLFYETPTAAWKKNGSLALAAPTLSKGIPVVQSRWQLWLPEGFTYRDYESNLRTPAVPAEAVLVKKIVRKVIPAGPEAYLSRTAGAPAAYDFATQPGKVPVDRDSQADEPTTIVKGQKTAGLLPVLLELPRNGRAIVFEGLYAPATVSVHYEDWWSRASRLWRWFVGGGLAFYFLGRARPWPRSRWAPRIPSASRSWKRRAPAASPTPRWRPSTRRFSPAPASNASSRRSNFPIPARCATSSPRRCPAASIWQTSRPPICGAGN